jgi:PAS domain S-box-containing protein
MTERTRREYHRTIAETLPHKVWVSNGQGTVEYVNTRWIEYTGQDLERLLGEGWQAPLHPDDRETSARAWQQAMATGEPYSAECRLRRTDGVYRWHLSRALPVLEDGKIVRWVGTATDIDDDRRAAEERAKLVAELREAVRARDEFLSVASHELRTPITTIGLQAEVLSRAVRDDAPRLAERCVVIQRQAERLEKLVATLLEVSRIATGRISLQLEPVDLGDVAREVATETASWAPAGQQIGVEAAPAVVGTWDRLRLVQIATNLVSNAVKYGEGKPILVRVRTEDEAAVFEVIDEGIGIAAEDRERIFDRFERAVSGHHYGGLGLGLWIVREIVRVLDGTVAVQSEPGTGSKFSVRLPRNLDARSQASSPGG